MKLSVHAQSKQILLATKNEVERELGLNEDDKTQIEDAYVTLYIYMRLLLKSHNKHDATEKILKVTSLEKGGQFSACSFMALAMKSLIYCLKKRFIGQKLQQKEELQKFLILAREAVVTTNEQKLLDATTLVIEQELAEIFSMSADASDY